MCATDATQCAQSRSSKERHMSGLQILAALVAAALLIYLVIALINPEDFS
jgi:K+-transporting ATPase KdpF subunit